MVWWLGWGWGSSRFVSMFHSMSFQKDYHSCTIVNVLIYKVKSTRHLGCLLTGSAIQLCSQSFLTTDYVFCLDWREGETSKLPPLLKLILYSCDIMASLDTCGFHTDYCHEFYCSFIHLLCHRSKLNEIFSFVLLVNCLTDEISFFVNHKCNFSFMNQNMICLGPIIGKRYCQTPPLFRATTHLSPTDTPTPPHFHVFLFFFFF